MISSFSMTNGIHRITCVVSTVRKRQTMYYQSSIGIEGVFVAQDQCLTTTLPKYSRVWYSSTFTIQRNILSTTSPQ